MLLPEIEKRLAELRQNRTPTDAPFDWDDVEYLRLLGQKLKLGVATFNPEWFFQMAEKLKATLEKLDAAELRHQLGGGGEESDGMKY